MAGNQSFEEAIPQSKEPMGGVEPVQGKVLPKLPKHPSVANAGPSRAFQRNAPSVDIPSASMDAGSFAARGRPSQRTGSRGRSRGRFSSKSGRIEAGNGSNPNVIEPSKLTTGPVEAPHDRGRNQGSSAPRLTRRDPSIIRVNQGLRDGADKLVQQQTQRSWAAIAKSAEKGYSLSYIPPSLIDGKPTVEISDEILQDADPKWKECLVGYFVGKKLPFKLTESAVKNIWGTQVVDILANGDGFFFFHIPDDSFRRKIVDGGPITILRVPMILQQWHPAIKLEKNQHETLPVWVRLKNIPIALWSALGISAVASAIGRPLHVDIQTERMRMISYARVCIEIKASQTMLEAVEIILNGEKWAVLVEYEWRPMACLKCGTFGHRCAPAIGTSSAVNKAPVPVGVAGNEPLPEGGQWETVRKKQSGQHSRNLAKSASPAIRPDLIKPTYDVAISQHSLPSGRSKTSTSIVAPALIVDPLDPLPDLGKDGHLVPTDRALSSSATSISSSDSDAAIDGSASNIGSGSEEDSDPPASLSTRRRIPVNKGGIPESVGRDPGLPIPSLVGPPTVCFQPPLGEPNQDSLLLAPMVMDPALISSSSAAKLAKLKPKKRGGTRRR
ncbi:uncharacterized protein LOC130140066 [Syzygium oleosum]|uniref:uncharacterized protein LOC130140066 n=1 Tax=Syzygium oleosum TaxID=219896 RepID=UPI0024BBA59B|nr:uncharacterized protein LOC130140066 [Syzygium oleosum]